MGTLSCGIFFKLPPAGFLLSACGVLFRNEIKSPFVSKKKRNKQGHVPLHDGDREVYHRHKIESPTVHTRLQDNYVKQLVVRALALGLGFRALISPGSPHLISNKDEDSRRATMSKTHCWQHALTTRRIPLYSHSCNMSAFHHVLAVQQSRRGSSGTYENFKS